MTIRPALTAKLTQLGANVKPLAEIAQGVYQLQTAAVTKGKPNVAGAGILAFEPNGRLLAEWGCFLGDAPQDVAEYEALLLGLTLALVLGVNHLEARLGSVELIQQITEPDPANHSAKNDDPRLAAYQEKARRLLPSFGRVQAHRLAWEDISRARDLADQATEVGWASVLKIVAAKSIRPDSLTAENWLTERSLELMAYNLGGLTLEPPDQLTAPIINSQPEMAARLVGNLVVVPPRPGAKVLDQVVFPSAQNKLIFNNQPSLETERDATATRPSRPSHSDSLKPRANSALRPDLDSEDEVDWSRDFDSFGLDSKPKPNPQTSGPAGKLSPSEELENPRPDLMAKLARLAAEIEPYPEIAPGTHTLQVSGVSLNKPARPAGAGFILYAPDGRIVAERGWYLGYVNTSAANYEAFILGLAVARALGVTHLQARSDGELVVKQILGQFKVRSPAMSLYWRLAKSILGQFIEIEVVHIDRERNQAAETLATEAANLGRKGILKTFGETPLSPDRPPSPLQPLELLKKKAADGAPKPHASPELSAASPPKPFSPAPPMTAEQAWASLTEKLVALTKSVTALAPLEDGAYRLQTDGASKGNPGPAGAGVVIFAPNGRIVAERGWYLGKLTNNAAEYAALIMGLTLAKALGINHLVIRLDSELVVKQILGKYAVHHPGLRLYWEKAWRILRDFAQAEIAHVYRENSQAADHLASEAAKLGGQGLLGVLEEMILGEGKDRPTRRSPDPGFPGQEESPGSIGRDAG